MAGKSTTIEKIIYGIFILVILLIFIGCAILGSALEEWLQRLSFNWVFGKE